MVKISPPAINFKSCIGEKPSTGRGIETSRTIPEITCHKTVKVWASLEGDRRSAGERWKILADNGWSNYEGVKRHADKP